MIEVKNLEKTWRRGRTRVGLYPTSFSVPDGQIVGVLGDNGAGKTTLLRAMAGLLTPKAGTALFDGKPAARQYERISYITGEGSYYPQLTVGEYGAFLEDLHSAFDPKRYRDFLAFFQLPEDVKIARLSTGQKARVELAAGFAKRADYYLMDEPFLGKIVAFGHHLVDVHPLLHKAAELVRGDEDGIAVRSFHERRSDLADVFIVELLGIVHPHFRKEGDVLLQDMASDDNEGAEEIPDADLVAPDLPGEVVPAFLDFLPLGMGGLFPCHGDVLGELEGLVDSLLPAGKDDRIDFLPVPVGGDMDLASLALEIVVGALCRVDLLGLVEILDLLGLGQVDLYLCVNQCDDLICKNIAQICFLLLC